MVLIKYKKFPSNQIQAIHFDAGKVVVMSAANKQIFKNLRNQSEHARGRNQFSWHNFIVFRVKNVGYIPKVFNEKTMTIFRLCLVIEI